MWMTLDFCGPKKLFFPVLCCSRLSRRSKELLALGELLAELRQRFLVLSHLDELLAELRQRLLVLSRLD